MSRTPGSKNFNRKLLQEVLSEKNIDLVGDYFNLCQTSETPVSIKASMLMHLMEFVYPKRRAEDSGGEPEQGPMAQIVVTEELLLKMIPIARGEK